MLHIRVYTAVSSKKLLLIKLVKNRCISPLKKYCQRDEQGIGNHEESDDINEPEMSQNDDRMEQVAAIACVIDDGVNESNEC